MQSAIYQGTIRHRRFSPASHAFSYRMFMLYLDLAELDEVFAGSRLFSSSRKAAAEFRRSDHLGDPDVPLDEAVRDLVEDRTGNRPSGPIRLLTHLRYFGYVFNPVSFYYCFDRTDSEVETIVAEVNNTPWGERHCYVLPAAESESAKEQGDPRFLRFSPEKVMHVSPFMPMDVGYDWRFGPPHKRLNVHMANLENGSRSFDATLQLQRRALSPAALRRVLLAFPLMTLRIIVAIHWQALRLWLKKVPVYDHPQKHQAKETAGAQMRQVR